MAQEPFGKFIAIVKVDVWKSPHARGLLRWGFLGPNPAMQVIPHPSLATPVASSSAPAVREVGEEGVFPTPWVVVPVTLAANMGDDFRLTSLIQSQKWPVGFSSSSEMVVWVQGDNLKDAKDGDFPYLLGVFPPAMPLDWALGCEDTVMGISCEGFEDTTLVFLTAIEEDHHWEVKGVHSKNRGRRELLNLECSINYDIACSSSRLGKVKAHML
jgi:hypothetical protein